MLFPLLLLEKMIPNQSQKQHNDGVFLFLVFNVGMMLALRNSVHDYSLCTVTLCMIMPLLFPPANLAVYLFFFFSILVVTGRFMALYGMMNVWYMEEKD